MMLNLRYRLHSNNDMGCIMGLFSFITEAGSKLGGKIYDISHGDEPVTGATQEQIDAAREGNIIENIGETGIAVSDLSVQVSGPNAVLGGKVETQGCSEKLTLVVGNQFGIGSVDCQLEVQSAEPESTMYTVKSGDTLGKIAKEMYGNASKYPIIFEANQPMLENPDKIYVGQNLRIPTL